MKNSAAIADIHEALTALGVKDNTLAPDQKHALDTQGYTVLDRVLTQGRIAQLRQFFDSFAAEQLPVESSRRETGTRHINNLHRVEAFWSVCIHPLVLAAAVQVFNRRFVCTMPHGREPLAGFGQQGLHMDWSTGTQAGLSFVATGICLLDDFTADNGATRVVPGSHRNSQRPNRRVADPAYVHPNEIVVEGKAGSVLFFNGHVLHSGTRKRSGLRRRTLQFSFIAHEVRSAIHGPTEMPDGTQPAARFIFGD